MTLFLVTLSLFYKMGTIISIIIGCLSVGIILSAPMGPIGILVIQRTMEKGRKSGLYTGLGAAGSDLFYCLLAGLGLSFVTDFITAHQDLFQIGGSIVLIIFAIFMILRSPVKGLKHDDEIKVNYTHDAVTGFAFTLSNPLIIFLIFPLFARFGFPSSEYFFYHYIIGYAFIVVGALLWWMAITYLVDKLRSKFNINSMWLINKIMGSIILILAVYGLISGLLTYFYVI